MLVYAGIDEAGYGPLLGPLCIAATVFVLDGVESPRRAPDLWDILGHAVCRRKRDRRRRIAVDDSKKLKGANGDPRVHPLLHLERAVLAFIAAGGTDRAAAPADDDALFDALDVTIARRPWYGSRTSLPVAHPPDDMRITISRLRRAMQAAGARCELLRCTVIDAASFNADVERAGTKAAVNFEAAMRLVNAVWRGWPDEHPRVIVDRQGGRTHYREELRLAFPEAVIRVIAEGEALSRYRLVRDGSPLTITFARQAEDGHLPVALASMTAKYVRELLMMRLNRFFRARLPELEPTAGYVQDGRRYLRDIEPVIRDLKLDRRTLVRMV